MPKYVYRLMPLVAALAWLVPAQADAQGSAQWITGRSSDQLLDELKQLIDKGEREDLARRRYIDDLRALAARYDWPWKRLVLRDTFADGNYTANPIWTVRAGRFDIHREFGLLSQQQVPQAQSQPSGQTQGNVTQQLLGTVLQQVLTPQGTQQQQQQQQQPPATRSDIYTPVKITNGFDLRVLIRTRNEAGRFEFGPYIAGQSDEGYRLVYAPGSNPSFALVRYSAFGSGGVQSAANQVSLPEGEFHTVQWLRHTTGEMAVYVDGKELIRTQDNAFTQGFDGVILSNLGGTYAVRELAVYGTP